MRGWITAYLVLSGSVTASGCESVYPLETPEPSGPIQEVLAKNPGNNAPFTFSIAPTTNGNALVIVAAVSSNNKIVAIEDDGDNRWSRLLDGVNSTDGTGERVEIWYVLGAASITEVMVDVTEGTAVDLMEWTGLAPPDSELFSHPGAFVVDSTVTTGVLETSTRALVIGMAVCRSEAIASAVPATLTSPGFRSAPFLVTQSNPPACGNTGFAVRDGGAQEVTWTLPATPCTSGIVAIPLD